MDDFGDYLPERAQPDETAKDDEGIAKIIDLKLPLAWLISSAIVICLSFGGLFVQVNGVAQQIAGLQSVGASRDAQMVQVLQQLATDQAELTNQQADISAINGEINDINKNIVWNNNHAQAPN